jgi:hypothetical protein
MLRGKVLREELAAKGGEDEVMGGAVNIHPLLNGTRVVKSKQTKWAMKVERIGVFRKVEKISVGKLVANK